ncbi:SIR2 family protein [Nocardioides sp. TF02-7]|uniref:SIR2 family protein n=1 Tax=Nocardioides sp. TF02-7 TaxID=2917724 RepID=UPI001F0682A6|nr:SIR2 family protein [Nocardioides sp. TF02-7]UMG93546.1 SIR2 family protein [Nocardioides sp. TF02-7]
MPGRGGHVFVLHGRIESVVHDYAIVPTWRDFDVRPYWHPVVGTDDVGRLRPDGWPGEGYGRAPGDDRVWFVDVGVQRGSGPEVVLERAVAVIAEIAAGSPAPGRNRRKPVVAVPVLGIEGGGLGARRGEVVRQLLEALAAAAAEHDVDVALVTPDPAVYGAAQHLRRQTSSWPLPARQLRKAQELGTLAAQGQLALFMGAGVSIPAGVPPWRQLLDRLAADAGVDAGEGFGALAPLDQAQYLNDAIPDLGRAVAKIVREAAVPSLSHGFLASLRCREAVTTNYDALYEAAVEVQRGADDAAAVLPWEVPKPGRQWVLKMHGDVRRPDSIVLTRRQFVSYDAETRPAGALLQSLLLTRHVLFVGASFTDDNVVRLAYEVDRFREQHRLPGTQGTLLDVDRDDVRRRLWRGKLGWLTMAGRDVLDRSRTLEIFLDAVAAHASSDTSWLLDERFGALIDTDAALVRAARKVHARARDAGPAWEPLVDALGGFGAGSEREEGG